MKRVVIIGGGPSGFAAARALVDEDFAEITILDKQPDAGGVWIYTGKGPMYKSLDTNIPVKLMEYVEFPFSGDRMRFADRTEVLEYVQNYARAIIDKHRLVVKYNVDVRSVSKRGTSWVIDAGPLTLEADFLVVATGHYEYPYIPEIWNPWLDNKTAFHAKNYTSPEKLSDQRLLMIGNGPSAVDIAVQCLGYAKLPLVISRRHEVKTDTFFEPQDATFKPEVTSVIHENGQYRVTFTDDSEETFDRVIVATGYLYDFPFLAKWDETHNSQEERLLHPQRQRLCNLYRRMFFGPDPSLAVLAMEKLIVPMPYAETQAAAIARVWHGRLEIPSAAEVHKLDTQLAESRPGNFHALGYPADVEYMYETWDWTAMASGSGGFVAERWNDEKRDIRLHISDLKAPEIKRKIKEAHERRKQATRSTHCSIL